MEESGLNHRNCKAGRCIEFDHHHKNVIFLGKHNWKNKSGRVGFLPSHARRDKSKLFLSVTEMPGRLRRSDFREERSVDR